MTALEVNAPVRRELYLNNIWSSSEQSQIIYPSNTMLKSTALANRVADMLAAISTAAEVLFKHTAKAISVREKANAQLACKRT